MNKFTLFVIQEPEQPVKKIKISAFEKKEKTKLWRFLLKPLFNVWKK